MGPDGNLETGWGGGWVVDELFVHVPRDTVGVRNDEKRTAIHTHWAVFTVCNGPVDAVDGRCGKLQLLGKRAKAAADKCEATVTAHR